MATKKQRKLNRLSYLAILAIIPILIVIGLLSIYGRNIDNLYVSIQQNEGYGLSLSKTEDFVSPTTFLKFTGMEDMRDMTYSRLPNKAFDGEGDHSDFDGRRYLAYTFYIKNSGEFDCTYNVKLTIESETKGVSSAMRVMLMHDEETTFYAKGTEVEPIGQTEETPNELAGKITNFLSPTIIFKNDNISLESNNVTKYTIVIWLEGEDNECVDDIKGGTIFMSMEFSVNVPEE